MALSLQRYRTPGYFENSLVPSLLKERSRKERERSMLIVIEKVDHLPEYLIVEIFSWLPVKDLLRFKTLNKSWYTLISSSNFIAKHLKNYYNNNDDWRGCLLVQHYISHAEVDTYELFVDETTRVLAYNVLDNMPVNCTHVCGPCDGLYYVYQHDSFRGLWNPAINEFELVPDIISKPDLSPMFTYSSYENFGFGLDPVSGDYKLVVIKGYFSTIDDNSDISHPPSVLVYSLRTNSWRYCGDLAKRYSLDENKCYMYVNGCYYWLVSHEFGSGMIISFDFATDVHKGIHVPDHSKSSMPFSKRLGIYDDSLALLYLEENYVFCVWTWNDDACWTKKITAGPFPDIWKPVGHWKDDRLILQREGGQLVLFDPETQEVADLGFRHGMICHGVFAYMESMVSIKDKIVGAAVGTGS